MPKSIYIAGPMSGIPEFNFPAFFQAQRDLEEEGWTVFNPANKESEREIDPDAFIDGDHVKANAAGFDFRECYLWDLTKVVEADAIYMLRGWEGSAGARGEHAAAVAMQKHYPNYKIYYA